MKREKLEMDYNSLQDQINPHFLFNNLSVLKSLIIYNQKSAVKFTEDFTDVYRYVLQSKDKRLVDIKDELAFIDAYLGLHKERLGDGLQIKFLISIDVTDLKIAPLTLQLLVENAIKHNIALKDSPLQINILAEDNYLEVRNNVQLRTTSYSTKTGLDNLLKRYEFLTKQKISIDANAEEFIVRIPLLT
jgi:LytS/YehU family sensor histidine kinase